MLGNAGEKEDDDALLTAPWSIRPGPDGELLVLGGGASKGQDLLRPRQGKGASRASDRGVEARALDGGGVEAGDASRAWGQSSRIPDFLVYVC